MYTEDMIDKVKQASLLVEENVELNSKAIKKEIEALGTALGTLTAISTYVSVSGNDSVIKDLNLSKDVVEADTLFVKEAVKSLVKCYEESLKKEIAADTLEAMLRSSGKPLN